MHLLFSLFSVFRKVMFMRLSIVFLAFFLLTAGEEFAAFSGIPADSTWILEKDKNGIKVYTRKAEGLEFKEFKAITTVNAPVSALVALVIDVETYPEWVENVKSSKILKVVNENEIIYYNEIKVPWPLSNRDNIVITKVIQNSGTNVVKVVMKGRPDYLPEDPDIVRMPKANGFWEFLQGENNETEVYLQYLADPGGNVPAWIVNMFVVDGPYQTLMNMKEFVKKEKYKNLE